MRGNHGHGYAHLTVDRGTAWRSRAVEGGDNTITRGGGGWQRDHGTAEPGSTVLVNDDGGDVAARTAL
jgi:hypothetical protein